jgi:hypothetical protein
MLAPFIGAAAPRPRRVRGPCQRQLVFLSNATPIELYVKPRSWVRDNAVLNDIGPVVFGLLVRYECVIGVYFYVADKGDFEWN